MRIVTVVGARPQFIKAAPVSAVLRGRDVEEVLVHTGQHYDEAMSAAFFRELDLPEPRHHLGVGSGSHGVQTGRMLAAIEEVLLLEGPDLVLVYGDTNSTLAAALAAAKLHVQIAHVEAGLRSFDRSMPEEVNRLVVDHLAAMLFAPSSTAVANLAAEGVRAGVLEVGDVMVDALLRMRPSLPPLPAEVTERGLAGGDYVMATLHRAATTDDPERLLRAVDLLESVGLPVFFPVHPRTQAALARTGLLDRLRRSRTVTPLPPLGYAATLSLLAGARAVLTDSGGLQKEAYLLATPCITLRPETEWVETVTAGWNTLTDLDGERVHAALARPRPADHPPLYGDGRAAERIADALVAMAAGGTATAMGGAATAASAPVASVP